MSGSAFGVLAQAAPAVPTLKPGQVLAFVLFDMALILVVARLVGFLATKIGQPRVVGEIVAGVLLGPTLFGATLMPLANPPAFLSCDTALALSGAQPTLTACLFPPQAASVIGVLGQIALVFFMFLVGLELDFAALKGKEKGIALVGVGVVVVPIAFGFLAGPFLFAAGGDGGKIFAHPDASSLGFTLMVGAMLSVTAFPVMARILQEKGLTKSDMGAIGVAAAAVVTVLMFIAVGVASGVAGGASTATLLRQVGLALLYIVVMFAVVRPLLAPLGRKYEERSAGRTAELNAMGWTEREILRDTPGIGARLTTPMFAVVIIVTLASAWIAHILCINVIVGGFLAGAVMPARKGLIGDMTAELFDLTAVILLPFFLAFSGLATDFTQLSTAAIPGIIVFLVAGIVSKWGAGAIFGKLGGLSWAQGNALGILMNCRGLLVLVVGIAALQTNVITPVMHVAGVLMALVTTAMTGPLFDSASKKLPAVEPEAPAPAPTGGGASRTGKSRPKARR